MMMRLKTVWRRRRPIIRMLSNVALIAACALAGCATTAGSPDALPSAAPESGRALIIGWGNTPAENARAAIKAEAGTRVTQLFVASVDGRKIAFAENIARVPPGEHALIISCGIYVGYRFFSYDSPMRAKVDANRVYRLRAHSEGRRCEPSLEDVTGKNE